MVDTYGAGSAYTSGATELPWFPKSSVLLILKFLCLSTSVIVRTRIWLSIFNLWSFFITTCCLLTFPHSMFICIGDVMISVLTSSAVDREFKPRSGETKDYEIGICCFSAKYAALRGKSKDWLVRNQDNVWEWSDMSISGLLIQWASTWSRHDIAEELLNWL